SLPENLWDTLSYEHFQFNVSGVSGGVQAVAAPEQNSPASPFVCGSTVSTYPYATKDRTLRSGDPICDWYSYLSYSNRTLFAVADGCNWGPAPREAAQRAVNASMQYLVAASSQIVSCVSAAFCLVRACMLAHRDIFLGKSTPSDAGGTTLVVGVIVETFVPGADAPQHYAIVCSIGDCKVFHYSPANKTCLDFLSDQRSRSSGDASDSGGRIGFKLNSYAPDLDNMQLRVSPVDPSDLFLVMSDGVHDNLDPLFLGLPYSPVDTVPRPLLEDSANAQKAFGPFVPGVVDLTVVRARNLVSKDPNGLSDPYCIVVFRDRNGSRKSKRMRTKVEWETLNPRWNALFTFEWTDPCDLVSIECWDKDPLGGDDFEGELTIGLYDLCRNSRSGARPVTRRFSLTPREKRKKRRDRDRDRPDSYGDIELMIGYTAFSPDELTKRNLSAVDVDNLQLDTTPSLHNLPEAVSPTVRDPGSFKAEAAALDANWVANPFQRDAAASKILSNLITRSANMPSLPDERVASVASSSGTLATVHTSVSTSGRIVGSRSAEGLVVQKPSISQPAISPVVGFHDEEMSCSDEQYDSSLRSYLAVVRPHLQSLLGNPEGHAAPTPAHAVRNCIAHARLTTATSRLFLETYRSKRLPSDYSLFPGKMDHTTLLSFIAAPPHAAANKSFLVSFAKPKVGSSVVYVRPLVKGKLRCVLHTTDAILLSATYAVPTDQPSLRGMTLDEDPNECFPEQPEPLSFSQLVLLPSHFLLSESDQPHITKKARGLYAVSFWSDASPPESPPKPAAPASTSHLLSLTTPQQARGKRSRSRKNAVRSGNPAQDNNSKPVSLSPTRHTLTGSRSSECLKGLVNNS
ncbi:MAG: protein phosphatase 2C domain-containing protein, partial [archaeon]|nr:protein phosphatase 2C domain-containing protein [archaeon]